MNAVNEWKIIDKITIAEKVEILAALDKTAREEEINEMVSGIPTAFKALRKELKEAFDTVLNTLQVQNKLSKYNIDLYFGIELFNILEDYGFNVRNASIDKVWYYISLYVIPDIIFRRFDSEKNTSSIEDHFWKKSRRIYPKTLWWYIYLSAPLNSPNKNERNIYLKRILEKNTTDTILQLVERSGNYGYRRELYFEIMRAFSCSKRDANTLRKVLVMNTTKTKVIEPALTYGGVKLYVKQLFINFGEELPNYDIT